MSTRRAFPHGDWRDDLETHAATEMIVYSFTVPGYGQPKQRARTTFRDGRARTYTPEETVNFEARVALFAHQAGVKPIAGPVFLEVRIVRPWPKGLSKKARANGAQPTTRPDLDNYLKSCTDALNGVAFVDDAAITQLSARKTYGDDARIEITVGQAVPIRREP